MSTSAEEELQTLWQQLKGLLLISKDPDAEIERITKEWVTHIDKSGLTEEDFRGRLQSLLQEARDEAQAAQRH